MFYNLPEASRCNFKVYGYKKNPNLLIVIKTLNQPLWTVQARGYWSDAKIDPCCF